MNIIDTHAHFFNLRYLPVRGIMSQAPMFNKVPKWLIPTASKFYVWITKKDPDLDKPAGSPLAEAATSAKSVTDYETELNRLMATVPDEMFDDAESQYAFEMMAHAGFQRSRSARSGPEKARVLVDFINNVASEDTQYFRWLHDIAVNSEREIMATYFRAYSDVDIVVDHMMDMDSFYEHEPPTYPFHDRQVKRAERLRDYAGKGKKVVTFVAWDPYRPDSPVSGLEIVQDAIGKHGAGGVKVYPPSGYRPFENTATNPFRHPKQDKIGHATINRRNLELFSWCASNDIPVFTHCTPGGFEAVPNAGWNCHPGFWEQLLKHDGMSGLKLGLGHAGGHGWFEERDYDFNVSFARKVYELCCNYENVYCEVGILNEVSDQKQRDIFKKRLAKLIAEKPIFAKKIMYGSDWHMLHTYKNFRDFLDDYIKLFSEPELAAYKDDFFYGNAKRYLGV